MASRRPVLLIHGGCGLIPRNNMTAEYEQECRESLKRSLRVGYDILKTGGSSVDAVVAATMIMEDHPNFNAGKGSVFTTAYTNELDAGIMDGWMGAAAGVSTVTRVKNPILLARRVMESTPHSILCGPGADAFAEIQGLSMVDQSYFFTDRRLEQLKKVLQTTTTPNGQAPKVAPTPQLDHNVPIGQNGIQNGILTDEKAHDTVGAVALDIQGRLATSSSTGGLTGKMPGRVSDSSIPGAGFWADKNVAVSMTGNGDYFIRRSSSHEIASLVNHGIMNANLAAEKVIFENLKDCSAGTIVLDSNGQFCTPYNSEGMFRGYMDADEKMDVRIWEH